MAEFLYRGKSIREWIQIIASEDAISRQAVLDATVKKNSIWNSITNSKGENLEEIISQLPSVNSSEKSNKWIPVSEGLPKKFSYVNCTCRSLIDDREDWVVETCYIPLPPNSPYSDWGNIPMLNEGNCEVVAWMYRDIPEPYKAESEGE